MPRLALLTGHGRSGTNFLLKSLDASPDTFGRNEPDVAVGSPFRSLPPLWDVSRPIEDFAGWDAASQAVASRIGDRDHVLGGHKRFVADSRVARWIGPHLSRRVVHEWRERLRPEIAAGEWRLPAWQGSQEELERAVAILKINQTAGMTRFVLAERPDVPVIHIVRHPGGRHASFLSRFVSQWGEEVAMGIRRHQLRLLGAALPDWGDRLGVVDRLSMVELETWMWRIQTEVIEEWGRDRPAYRTVVYEALAADPAAVTKDLLTDLGLDFDDATEARLLAGLGTSQWGRLEGSPTEVAERWRSKLAGADVEAIERITAGSPAMRHWS